MTTTNISKIRDDMRNIADMAYRHRDMKLVGWSGRYFETQHQPEDNGASEANQISTRVRKIKPVVWKLYESTATGQHSQSVSGLAFYRSPKVVLLLLALAYLIYSVASAPPVLSGSKSSSAAAAPAAGPGAAPAQVVPVAVGQPSGLGLSADAGHVKAQPPAVLDPFHGYRIRVYGSVSVVSEGGVERDLFMEVYNRDESQRLRGVDFAAAGYVVTYLSRCLIKLQYQSVARFADCAAKPRQNDVERVPRGFEGLSPAPPRGRDDVGGAPAGGGGDGGGGGVLPGPRPGAVMRGDRRGPRPHNLRWSVRGPRPGRACS